MLSKEIIEEIINETGNNLAGTDFIEKKVKEIHEGSKDIADKGTMYQNISELELLSLFMLGYEMAITRFNDMLKTNNGERSIEI